MDYLCNSLYGVRANLLRVEGKPVQSEEITNSQWKETLSEEEEKTLMILTIHLKK